MSEQRYYRRVIRITAEDSPNVRLALAQLQAGGEPTGEQLVPGVMPWAEYRKRRTTWDPIRQSIGLDARFWEGAEVLLFPPQWLDASAAEADRLDGGKAKRTAKALGCDPGEGGAETGISVVDELGLLELWARPTPDTSVIEDAIITLGRRWGVPPNRWGLDRGGGGKQIADRMRRNGYPVQTVGFGEAVIAEPRRGLTPFSQRVGLHEAKSTYKNRRAQMYGDLRALLDPAGGVPFALPARYTELRRQLAPIPLRYEEGKLVLPPKSKPPGSNVTSLIDIIGHSPDQADSLAVAVHIMIVGDVRPTAGGA